MLNRESIGQEQVIIKVFLSPNSRQREYCFDIVCPFNICPHLFLSGLAWSITPRFTDRFQYDLSHLFSIMSRCAILKSKVKVVLQINCQNCKLSLFEKCFAYMPKSISPVEATFLSCVFLPLTSAEAC